MTTALRIGMVAGEASGDILGAGLMQALREKYPHCRFEGIGGDLMLAEGFHSFFPQDRLAVMGLMEPLKRLPELLRMRRFLKRHFLADPPDVFIGIDSPDFNLDLELALRQGGVKTAHYVSPSVWAWRQGRIKKIARAVDLMLTLLPFEAEFYERHGVPVKFVGHPLADKIPLEPDITLAREGLGLEKEKTYIAILPGSRGGEVEHLAPVFFDAARWCCAEYGPLEFIVPAANAFRRAQIEAILKGYPDLKVHLVNGRSHQVMAASDAVVMASGTTTLEALLLKRPMVIAYRAGAVSFAIISPMVKVKHIGLPNLLADERLVPEFVQNDAQPQAIGAELVAYLRQPERVEQLQERFLEIHRQLARNANRTAAEVVAQLLSAGSNREHTC